MPCVADIDAVTRRHKINARRPANIRSAWLPFEIFDFLSVL